MITPPDRAKISITFSAKDVATGLSFSAVSLLFLSQMSNLGTGSLAPVGPGFLPLIVALSLFCLSLLQLYRGFRPKPVVLKDIASTDISEWGISSVIRIAISVIYFAISMAYGGGLVIAGIGTVLFASFATGQGALLVRLALVAIVVGASVLIFCIGLGLPMPIWPKIGG